MGGKSNYHDSKMVQRTRKLAPDVLDTPEHSVYLSRERRYDPGTGKMSMLTEQSTGDQFYLPNRYYRADKGWVWSREMIDATYPDGYVSNVRIVEPAWRTAELEAQMPTFRGVPPSAAELYREGA